jgi:indolepyruvate ferredoxin oxidoreductase
LRGTAFDLFGHTAERRRERQLRSAYEGLVDEVAAGLSAGLSAEKLEAATALLGVSQTIRGFGPVREAAMAAALRRLPDLRAAWQAGRPARDMQAAE